VDEQSTKQEIGDASWEGLRIVDSDGRIARSHSVRPAELQMDIV
jgi:hypothetical protein